MVLWQTFLVVGIISLIFELFFPMMFFLTFAIGAFLTAIFAVFFTSLTVLIPIFAIGSVILLILFRPFLAKQINTKNTNTGLDGQYIGKIAKVIEPVNKYKGAITIYGERWEARSEEDIPENSEVKIIKNDSLIMHVEKI